MDRDDAALDARIEAAVRRYIQQVARRYLPIVVGVGTLILIATLLPSKLNSSTVATGPVAAGVGGYGPAGISTGSTEPSAGSGGQTVAGAATPGASGTGAGSGSTGASGGGGGAVAGTPGVAVSGVKCGPGVRQVTWSKYAPPCVPVWSGNNGGATSRGVTASQITFVVRQTTDYDTAAKSFGWASFAQVASYYQTMIGLFNRTYELYGRKVVLKTYNGQGSTLDEQADQGQAQAQADAQTEYDLGSFISVPLFDSAIYAIAEANKGIVSIGAPMTRESVSAQYAPYFYDNTVWPSSDNWGRGAAETACARMNGMPAIYAHDPLSQRTTRVWGLTRIEQAEYAAAGTQFLATSKALCGLNVKQDSQYNYNFTDEAQQAVAIVAQMKAAGVTTLVFAGDPLMYVQMTLAAAQQNWYPEWLIVDPTEQLTREANQTEAASSIKVSPQGQSIQELKDAWHLAAPGQPDPPGGLNNLSYMVVYQTLQQAFGAIQMAGPNLTPSSFRAGRAAIPGSHGDFGYWNATAQPGNIYNLDADFTLAKFSPTAASQADGKQGAYLRCNGAARYPFVDPTMGSGQLQC